MEELNPQYDTAAVEVTSEQTEKPAIVELPRSRFAKDARIMQRVIFNSAEADMGFEGEL